MKKYEWIRFSCFILLFCLLFVLVSAVLRDKRIVGEYNPTTKIKGFYEEKRDSLDFVFVGSSQLYAHIAPAVLWQEYGMTSYDFAANEQPLWISYYYIREALKYQHPKAVVLEIFTVYGDTYEEEGVNHINLDDLPFSLNKLKAIHTSVPKELRNSFYFDLAKYHNTWSSLDRAKYEATFRKQPDPMKGYSPFVFVKDYAPQAADDVAGQTEIEELPKMADEWLHRIIRLTREKGVDLILLKTPNGNAERQKLYNAVSTIAERENIPFLNLNTEMDGEAHINIIQAKRVTEAVGRFLSERYETALRQARDAKVQESFDRSVRLFDSYYKKCELMSVTEYDKYLEFIKSDPYLVFLCKNANAKNPVSRLLILDGGRTVVDEQKETEITGLTNSDEQNDEKSEKDLQLYGLKIQMSAGTDTSIIIDGLDYSLHTNGYNLVVYDKVLNEFVEMVSFDEEQEMEMTRK